MFLVGIIIVDCHFFCVKKTEEESALDRGTIPSRRSPEGGLKDFFSIFEGEISCFCNETSYRLHSFVIRYNYVCAKMAIRKVLAHFMYEVVMKAK